MHSIISSIKRVLPVLAALLIVILIWELVRQFRQLPAIVLPSFYSVIQTFLERWDYIVEHLMTTLLETIVGFSIGFALGFGLAILFVLIPLLRKMFFPLALILKSTPLIVLVPLIVLWLGSGNESKIAMAAILCFFPILVSSFDGLKQTDSDYLELFKLYGATKAETFLKARIPASLPQVFSGVRIAIPLAFVGAVIGEYLSATKGIGYIVANASYHLETSLVFAAIATVSLASLTIFGVTILIERKVTFWNSK